MGKEYFERWEAKLRFRIKLYHEANKIFIEKYSAMKFRSQIKQSNYVVLYLAIKIPQPKERPKPSIHKQAKRYWQEAITTMIWPYALKYFA